MEENISWQVIENSAELADQRKASAQKPGNSSSVQTARSLPLKQRQKRVRKIAEGLIALAVKEKDNFRDSYCNR